MSYSQNVEQHHRLMYANNVIMVTQQTRNPFGGHVTELDANGEAKSIGDLMDKGEYQYGEDRSRRNPELPLSGRRRWLIRPPVIESGQYLDKEDKLDGAILATSDYVREHTRRVMRGRADRILGVRMVDGVLRVTDGGILGHAWEGKRPTNKLSLPSSQIIGVNSTGLTLAKLREAKLRLRRADFGVEDDDAIVCAITADQEDDLIGIAEATKTNLNAFSVDNLREGKPTRLMGIDWIMTNRLPRDASGNRICPMWSKKNIQVGVWQDVRGDIWNDTSAKNLPYCYVSAYIDCVRVQDAGVIAIECQES